MEPTRRARACTHTGPICSEPTARGGSWRRATRSIEGSGGLHIRSSSAPSCPRWAAQWRRPFAASGHCFWTAEAAPPADGAHAQPGRPARGQTLRRGQHAGREAQCLLLWRPPQSRPPCRRSTTPCLLAARARTHAAHTARSTSVRGPTDGPARRAAGPGPQRAHVAGQCAAQRTAPPRPAGRRETCCAPRSRARQRWPVLRGAPPRRPHCSGECPRWWFESGQRRKPFEKPFCCLVEEESIQKKENPEDHHFGPQALRAVLR